ncbi:DUF393 domain-containing protein [Pseudoduganella sp. FT55W]|uniref:DUF393 domain-containing protein n=1 Tax=Duganella rivi TaxID=2666083 RepID=A0A7X4KE45_9BURK|nr:DCC1-like thiol-disulfide oxidoreductase family protein [Duganella rivi]MYM69083.1 DUF393 domain-containing protein [Duganella rivi]
MNKPVLMLYYDGNCSICRAQMSRLRVRDRTGCLAFSDIASPDFSLQEVGVSMEALGTEIHVRTADGRLLVGIDSLVAIYTALGRGWLVAPLKWRMLRPLFAAMYRTLARNRYRLSACADGVCNMAGKS